MRHLVLLEKGVRLQPREVRRDMWVKADGPIKIGTETIPANTRLMVVVEPLTATDPYCKVR